MASMALFQALTSSPFFGKNLPKCRPQQATSVKPCLITMEKRRERSQRTERKPDFRLPMQKLHVKIGDTIKVISGHEKGKIGEISKVNKRKSTVIVKDINFKIRHMKGQQEGESGQIIEVEGPIHSSNVMLYSKTQNVASRVGHKILEDGRKVRYLIKTGETLDDSPENWKMIFKRDDKKD